MKLRQMTIGRKVAAAGAVLTMAAGLTLVGPGPAGAQSTATLGCSGNDEETEILLDTIPEWNGIVPIPVGAFVSTNVPATLAPGESAEVSFNWQLNPGDSLAQLARSVNIVSLTGVVDVYVEPAGGIGGPYQAPSNISISIDPPSYPDVAVSGTVTAGEAGSTISYTLYAPRLDLETVSSQTTQTQVLSLSCTVTNPVLATTQVVEGSAGTQGGVQVTTTAPRASTGTSQPTVTG